MLTQIFCYYLPSSDLSQIVNLYIILWYVKRDAQDVVLLKREYLCPITLNFRVFLLTLYRSLV
jgi:hypothetical protein